MLTKLENTHASQSETVKPTERRTGRLVKEENIPCRNATRSVMYPLGLLSKSVCSQS